jgi:hypothetical protein
MPVMPSLANSKEGNVRILRGVGHHIVRMISVQVSGAIHEPSEMQNNRVSQPPGHEERRPEALSPELHGDLSREHEAHVQGEPRIKLLLEHNNRILVKVAEVQLLPRANDLRMLLQVQPSHVRKEEPAHGIVRISVGLGILVVDAMVSRPMVNRSLIRDGVAQHEEEAYGEGGAVGSVGPEAMDTNSNAESTVCE